MKFLAHTKAEVSYWLENPSIHSKKNEQSKKSLQTTIIPFIVYMSSFRSIGLLNPSISLSIWNLNHNHRNSNGHPRSLSPFSIVLLTKVPPVGLFIFLNIYYHTKNILWNDDNGISKKKLLLENFHVVIGLWRYQNILWGYQNLWRGYQM